MKYPPPGDALVYHDDALKTCRDHLAAGADPKVLRDLWSKQYQRKKRNAHRIKKAGCDRDTCMISVSVCNPACLAVVTLPPEARVDCTDLADTSAALLTPATAEQTTVDPPTRSTRKFKSSRRFI